MLQVFGLNRGEAKRDQSEQWSDFQDGECGGEAHSITHARDVERTESAEDDHQEGKATDARLHGGDDCAREIRKRGRHGGV